MSATWQDHLISKHPRLFRTTLDGREYVHGHAAVGDGWRQIVETAVVRIVKAADDYPTRIFQVKSKDATLRIYWHTNIAMTDDVFHAIEEAIALAEARSACTCEACGCEGRLYADGDSLTTACREHARGTAVQIRAGWENLHLVRKSSSGSSRIIACRRYIRATDSFVDATPSNIGIEG